jgi:hypothetical protein
VGHHSFVAKIDLIGAIIHEIPNPLLLYLFFQKLNPSKK